MKKIYSLLGMLMLYSLTVYGQYPANRTTKTIIADVLAQMPAQQTEQYYSQIKDLASTGEEGILQLVRMMNLPGKGSNAQVEYALSGLSHYVSAEGMEAQRLITANAYLKALDMVVDSEIRAFIIRQLEIIGGDKAVIKLASLLSDEILAGPAARALSAIGTQDAKKELLNALNASMNDKIEGEIILAVAKLQIADAENTLKRLLETTNSDKRKTVLYALSRVGSKISLPDLAVAAQKDNYTMQKDGATEAYIALIKRVLEQGNTKDAEKSVNDLMKNARKAGQVQTCEAALQLQMQAKPINALKLLQNTLKDNSRNYRYAALTFASDYADSHMYSELIKSLKKANPEVQTDILNWLGQECGIHEKREVIKPLINETAITYLTAKNLEVKKAAANILTKTADHNAIMALANLLKDADPKTVEIAKNALSSTKGNIASAVAPVISEANAEGKIAGLQLLAQRKSVENTAIVLEQINSNSQDVKKAAFIALKDVVSTTDLNKLYTLLEATDADNITFVQQAIISALYAYPKEKKYETILTRMQQVTGNKQYLYYPVLATTGDEEALDMIVDRFSNEQGVAKDAAFGALLNWKGMNVAEKLLSICKNKDDILYFDKAINRYIQLVSDPKLSGEDRRLFLTNAMGIAKTDAQKNAILTQLGSTGSYQGMLLAGQYLDNKPTQQAAAQSVMTIALANKQHTGKNVADMLNKVISVLDNPDADYQKQAIKDHLNNMIIPEPYKLTPEEKAEGYTILFDGTNMDNWTGNTVDYIIEGGCISLHPSNGHGGNLYTKKEYGNFIFRFEFQLTPAANNGLGIRTPMKGDAAYVGMELQILDNEAPVYSELAPYQYHGSVYGIIPAKRGYLKPMGEWNYQEVIADGDNIKVILNGTVILDGNIRNAAKNGTADKRNHPGLFNKTGHIGFLGHGSPVKFKNIRIKELK